MNSKRGKVYIIGAGPGDPDLITVKGLRALQGADCILYDFLSPLTLVDYAKDSCEKICVGKADGLHLKEQSEINRLLFTKALIYKSVVRLKGGDPFTFSRGYEEARYLSKRNVAYEVIPGITSAIAGPETFSIPLTVKNRISSVAIVTGRKKDINAEVEAPSCGTVVYLMAVANIARVVDALRRSKRSANTPCAFIERATTPHARMVRGTLKTIETQAAKRKIRPPAVFIVGDVVKKRITNGKKNKES